MSQLDSIRLDDMLRMFDETSTGVIRREILFGGKQPEGWSLAVSYLTEEGYLKESENYFEITYKGKAFLHNGGFTRKNRMKRIEFYCAVVAAAAGVLGLIVSLFTLCH